jgi:hypothetical protein
MKKNQKPQIVVRRDAPAKKIAIFAQIAPDVSIVM